MWPLTHSPSAINLSYRVRFLLFPSSLDLFGDAVYPASLSFRTGEREKYIEGQEKYKEESHPYQNLSDHVSS